MGIVILDKSTIPNDEVLFHACFLDQALYLNGSKPYSHLKSSHFSNCES